MMLLEISVAQIVRTQKGQARLMCNGRVYGIYGIYFLTPGNSPQPIARSHQQFETYVYSDHIPY